MLEWTNNDSIGLDSTRPSPISFSNSGKKGLNWLKEFMKLQAALKASRIYKTNLQMVQSGPLKDICPFTTMGIFNRGITDTNRKSIAKELAKLLGIEEPVPDSFEGIPVLNNQRSWFFTFDKKRQPDDIETLWEIFRRQFDCRVRRSGKPVFLH